jgi:hypothetical protein
MKGNHDRQIGPDPSQGMRHGTVHVSDVYFSLKLLSTYAGLSVRTLRSLLRHPVTPLPHYRIGNKILVRRSEYDAWASRFKSVASDALDTVVDDMLRGLR